jgi:hypothetical protein
MRLSRGRLGTCGVLAGVILVAATGCSGVDTEAELLSTIAETDGHNVRLDDVVDGEWDSFLVVCPYDPDVSERLGFEWTFDTNTGASENSQTIRFVENDEVTSTTTLSFDDINLCTDVWPLLPRDTALEFTQPSTRVWHATL